MWVFGTSIHGLAMTDRCFWLLTRPEFNAHKRRYEAAHGIKPAPTWQERRAEAKLSPRIVQAASLSEAQTQLHRQRCASASKPKSRSRRRPNG